MHVRKLKRGNVFFLSLSDRKNTQPLVSTLLLAVQSFTESEVTRGPWPDVLLLEREIKYVDNSVLSSALQARVRGPEFNMCV